MSDTSLTPTAFLGGHAVTIGGTALTEVSDLSLVSIAVPLGGEAALAAAAESAFGAEVPAVGRSTGSADGTVRFLGLGRDLIFALLPADGPLAAPALARRLGPVGYLTDQTDAWVILRLDGPLAVPALQRTCMLDLHDDVFPPERVARTVMEHLGTILLREDRNRFLLMSASSSARSFLHAVETSLRNCA